MAENAVSRGTSLVDLVEPAWMLLPQLGHLSPVAGPPAGLVLLGFKV